MSSPVPVKDKTYFITDDKKRQIAIRGFSYGALEVHLKEQHLLNPKKPWCDLDCGARTFYGRASEENRKQMRIRFSRATNVLLDRDLVVIKNYAPHGPILAVKLYDGSEADRAFAEAQYELARERGELKDEKLRKFAAIVGSSERRAS